MDSKNVVRVPFSTVARLACECEIELPGIESRCANGVEFANGRDGFEMLIKADGEWKPTTCRQSPFVSFIGHGLSEEIAGFKMAVGSVSESVNAISDRLRLARKGRASCRVRCDGESVEMEVTHSTGNAVRRGTFIEPIGFVELDDGMVVDLRPHPWSKKKGKLYIELEEPHLDELPPAVEDAISMLIYSQSLLTGGRKPGRRDAIAIASLSSGKPLSFTIGASAKL